MKNDGVLMDRYKHMSNSELELSAKNDPLLTEEERVGMARVLWIRKYPSQYKVQQHFKSIIKDGEE